jgi:hypothetical protein
MAEQPAHTNRINRASVSARLACRRGDPGDRTEQNGGQRKFESGLSRWSERHGLVSTLDATPVRGA